MKSFVKRFKVGVGRIVKGGFWGVTKDEMSRKTMLSCKEWRKKQMEEEKKGERGKEREKGKK